MEEHELEILKEAQAAAKERGNVMFVFLRNLKLSFLHRTSVCI